MDQRDDWNIKKFEMSNFVEEDSRQQRLKRWIVAPFWQAREDKGLSRDKLIHVVWFFWVHLSVHYIDLTYWQKNQMVQVMEPKPIVELHAF